MLIIIEDIYMYKNKTLQIIGLIFVFSFVFFGTSVFTNVNLVNADSGGGIGGGGGGGGGDCFIAGTQITMADGTTKNIENIVIGDKVKTVDIETMEIEDNFVEEISSPIHFDMVRLIFENGENKNTFDHPYYVKGKGFSSYKPDLTQQRYGLNVDNLEIGDIVYRLDDNNELAEEKLLNITEEIKEVQTYNLHKVSNNHNFFAGGILVHNKGEDPIVITPTCTISISPSSIEIGSSANLSWSTTNSTLMVISPEIGYVSTAPGYRTISPITTTTYTGLALGIGGNGTCSATITVTPKPIPAPTCSISVSPSSITNGDKTTLSWSTTNVASGSINNGVGIVSTSGARSVYPTTNTTYTGTFVGNNGSTINCNASVTVTTPIPAPTCSMSVSPSSITNGDKTTLSWSTSNATSMSINQSVGFVSVSGGARSLYPTNTTTYIGTVTGAGGSATCSRTVTVVPVVIPNPTCSMIASPTTITTGGSSTITWSTTNVASASFNNGISSTAITGNESVTPSTSTTYTGTFVGNNGSTVNCSATVTVTATPPAPTCSMTANPTSIDDGDTSTLTWSTTNVASASIDNGVGTVSVNGTESVTPNTTTLYVGSFIGNNGVTITCDATVTVANTPPPAPSCSMSFNPNAVAPGGSSTLTWTSTNTTSGTIDNGIGSVNINDSISITPSAASTFTGTFVGPGGTTTCAASISVSSNVCTVNCGGGGNNPPSVSLARFGTPGVEPEPSYIYLNQVPYTGYELKFINGQFIMVRIPTSNFIMAN